MIILKWKYPYRSWLACITWVVVQIIQCFRVGLWMTILLFTTSRTMVGSTCWLWVKKTVWPSSSYWPFTLCWSSMKTVWPFSSSETICFILITGNSFWPFSSTHNHMLYRSDKWWCQMVAVTAQCIKYRAVNYISMASVDYINIAKPTSSPCLFALPKGL